MFDIIISTASDARGINTMDIIRPCRHPGCFNLTEKPNGFCETHQSDALIPYKRKDNRPSASKRGYDSRWQKASKGFLAKHPFCVACLKEGKHEPATCVDHIRPHKGNKELFWDRTNWQPLCQRCHSRKTAAEENGGWY